MHTIHRGHSRHHHKCCNDNGYQKLPRRIYCILGVLFRSHFLEIRFDSIAAPKRLPQSLKTVDLGVLVDFEESTFLARLLEVGPKSINFCVEAQISY